MLTSCAEDFVTWDDVFPPGEEVDQRRAGDPLRLAAWPEPVVPPAFRRRCWPTRRPPRSSDAERWIDLQGPVVPALVEAALDTDADALIFYPYLYYPTVRVIDRVAGADRPASGRPRRARAPPAGLPPGVRGRRRAGLPDRRPSASWSSSAFPVATHRQLLLGLGVDDPGRAPRRPPGALPMTPICCVWAGSTATRAPPGWPSCSRPTSGAIPDRSGWCWPVRWSRLPEAHPDIDVVGPVSERREVGAARRCRWPWCPRRRGRPSRWSWPKRGAPGTPVVVNAACRATVEHCRRSGGGLCFAGFGEFEAVVDLVTGDEACGAELGQRGRAYVDRWFRWPRVIDRYADFVESVAASDVRGARRGSQIPVPSGRWTGAWRPPGHRGCRRRGGSCHTR